MLAMVCHDACNEEPNAPDHPAAIILVTYRVTDRPRPSRRGRSRDILSSYLIVSLTLGIHSEEH